MRNILSKRDTGYIFAICALVIILLAQKCEKDVFLGQVHALSDSLKTERNSLGQHVATVKTLQTSNHKLLASLTSKEETILELKKEAKEYKKRLLSSTSFSGNTEFNSSSSSTITRVDTVTIDSLVYLYPTYETSYKDEWINWEVTASQDTITNHTKIREHFTVSQVLEKSGFLNLKRTPVTKVKSLNPYTETTEARSYYLATPKPNLTIGPYLGVDLFTLRPSIGVSAQLPLIRLRLGKRQD